MKLAIFDIDGTLTHTHGYDQHFFAALAGIVGAEHIENSLDTWTHVTDEAIARDVLEAHGQRADEAALERVKARYAAALEKHLREADEVAGASAFLDHLADQEDWRVAMATGNWDVAAARKLAAAGVEPRGMPVVGCDGRPSRTELMEHALALSTEAHGAFEHVVYVGDASWDVRACRALQWNFVGIHAERERLLRLGAVHVLADYLEVDAALAALEAAQPPRELRDGAPR